LACGDAEKRFEQEHAEADGHDETDACLGIEWALLFSPRGRDDAVRHGEVILEVFDLVSIEDGAGDDAQPMSVSTLCRVHEWADEIEQRLIGISWTHGHGHFIREVIQDGPQQFVLRAKVSMHKSVVDTRLFGNLPNTDR